MSDNSEFMLNQMAYKHATFHCKVRWFLVPCKLVILLLEEPFTLILYHWASSLSESVYKEGKLADTNKKDLLHVCNKRTALVGWYQIELRECLVINLETFQTCENRKKIHMYEGT